MRIQSLLFASALLLGGCSLPRPTIVASDVVDTNCPTSETPPASGSLLFVTLRAPTCGPGGLDATSYRAAAPQFAATSDVATTLVSKRAWQVALDRQIELARGRAPVLFIHGFGNSNATALTRARAIQAAVGSARPVVALTWPSYDKIDAYFWDETNAAWGLLQARQVIAELVERYPRLTIVAHSMGNHFAADAIADLRSRKLLGKVDRIVMASADIDRPSFHQVAVPQGAGVPVTMYASRNDKALSLSWRLHGYPRLGDMKQLVNSPVAAYVFANAPHLEVVETSGLKHARYDIANHADFIETAEGAADLCRVLLELPHAGARSRPESGPANYFSLVPGAVGPSPCSTNAMAAVLLATGR